MSMLPFELNQQNVNLGNTDARDIISQLVGIGDDCYGQLKGRVSSFFTVLVITACVIFIALWRRLVVVLYLPTLLLSD
jgi:hypothetical protein